MEGSSHTPQSLSSGKTSKLIGTVLVFFLALVALYYYGTLVPSDKSTKSSMYLDDSGTITSSSLNFPEVEQFSTVSLDTFPEWMRSIISLTDGNSKIIYLQQVFYMGGATGYMVELSTTQDIKKNFVNYFIQVPRVTGFAMISNGVANQSFVIEFMGENHQIRITQKQGGLIEIQTLLK